MKKWILICGCLCFWLLIPMSAYGQETIEEHLDYREVDQILEEIFPEEKIHFSDLVSELTEGENVGEILWEFLREKISYEFAYAKKGMLQILLLVLVAAVFHNFAGVFQNQQTSEMGFYVLYALFITICVSTFRVLMDSVGNGITNLLQFFRALGPVYFMVVAVTTGSASSIVFYNILLFIIYLADLIITSLLLPLVQTFFVLRILNEMSKEDYLSKFGDFVEMLIKWILRVFLAGVVGINLVQGMLSPAIDAVKRNMLRGGGEALPIIGEAIGGVTEVVLGTAVLIRNGIGVAGMIISVGICLVPVVQMAAIVVAYRFLAALVQPISEKRMVNCIGNMADGAGLLLQIILTSGALFLIVIATVSNM